MRRGAAAASAAMLVVAACAAPPAPQPRQAADGEALYRRCAACHALEPGLNTPAGPTLHAVVGRAIAAEPGFNYSPALRRLAERHARWTPRLLGRFIADPEALASGTEMGFPGMPEAGERRALIQWLRQRAARSGDATETVNP